MREPGTHKATPETSKAKGTGDRGVVGPSSLYGCLGPPAHLLSRFLKAKG